MRSFEVGDIVFSKKLGIGYVQKIENGRAFCYIKEFMENRGKYPTWAYFTQCYSLENGIECTTSGELVEFDIENDRGLLGCDVIKAIRKPRPGSKEARDIVAMLALEHRKSLNSTIALNLGSKKQIYIADKKVQSPYRKARAMLQVQS